MCRKEDAQDQATRSKNLKTCRKKKLEKKHEEQKQRIWGRKKYEKLA